MNRPGLKQEVVHSVVSSIDIDSKLQKAAQDIQQKGRTVLKELQAQQRDRDELLSQEVAEHLEHQRRLRDEHLRLRGVTADLVRWLMPLTTGAAGMAAASTGAVGAPPRVAAGPDPAMPAFIHQDRTQPPTGAAAGATYSVILRKADGLGLGLEVSLQDNGCGLFVEGLEPGGVAEAWNRRCAAEADMMRAICPGDTIVRVNEAQGADAMLREFEARWLLRLTLVRGQPAVPSTSQEPVVACSNAVLRPDAPEFLPDRLPLQARQLPVIPEDGDHSSSASEKEAECRTSGAKASATRTKVHHRHTGTAYVDKENMSHIG